MKIFSNPTFLLFVSLIVFCNFNLDDDKNGDKQKLIKEILNKLIDNSLNIDELQLDMLMRERIDGKIQISKSHFKISSSPFKLYMKQEYPMQGMEVLFVDGENNNKAWVKPSTFPWRTINLDPLSKLMRNDFHHSIFKSGYSFLIEVLVHLQKKYANEYNNMLTYNGIVKYNGIVCHKIAFSNPHFKYTTYTTKPGDNLELISKKLKVSDYMILELNPTLRSFGEVQSGKKLTVPNDYAKSITLYIHQKEGYLLGIKVYDDKGLWEEYTYSNISINPGFKAIDFSTKNSAYNF